MGLPLHVMRMSCSLCTVTPSLVKIDIMPSSAVLPTLISESGNSVNVSACLAEVAGQHVKKGDVCQILLYMFPHWPLPLSCLLFIELVIVLVLDQFW